MLDLPFLETEHHRISTIYNSNMTSFICYMDNAVIEFQIYFTWHMHIVGQIMNTISKWFQTSTGERGAYKH
jgi:hypothetical protein